MKENLQQAAWRRRVESELFDHSHEGDELPTRDYPHATILPHQTRLRRPFDTHNILVGIGWGIMIAVMWATWEYVH